MCPSSGLWGGVLDVDSQFTILSAPSFDERNCHFPTHATPTPPCLECQRTWMPAGIQCKGTDLKVIHGRAPIRLLGIWYNMWLDSAAHKRYDMDGITEMTYFLRKNRDPAIENSLRLVECSLAPLLAFSGLVIIWPEKELKQLTAAFVRRNKEAWYGICHWICLRHFLPSPETKEASRWNCHWPSYALQYGATSPDVANLTMKQDSWPKSHTRTPSQNTDAWIWRTSNSKNSWHGTKRVKIPECLHCHLTSTLGIKVSWDPFHPDWIASATSKDVAQVYVYAYMCVYACICIWIRICVYDIALHVEALLLRFSICT